MMDLRFSRYRKPMVGELYCIAAAAALPECYGSMTGGGQPRNWYLSASRPSEAQPVDESANWEGDTVACKGSQLGPLDG